MPIRLGVIQLADALKKHKFDQIKLFEFVFCEATKETTKGKKTSSLPFLSCDTSSREQFSFLIKLPNTEALAVQVTKKNLKKEI